MTTRRLPRGGGDFRPPERDDGNQGGAMENGGPAEFRREGGGGGGGRGGYNSARNIDDYRASSGGGGGGGGYNRNPLPRDFNDERIRGDYGNLSEGENGPSPPRYDDRSREFESRHPGDVRPPQSKGTRRARQIGDWLRKIGSFPAFHHQPAISSVAKAIASFMSLTTSVANAVNSTVPAITSIINTGCQNTHGMPKLKLCHRENVRKVRKVRCIVIAPTRELANQLYQQATKFCYAEGIVKPIVTYGQKPMHQTIMELSEGCDILITTVGRLRHFMAMKKVLVNVLQFLVLDEADRLLEERRGSESELTPALDELRSNSPVTLLFSATMSPAVTTTATTILKNPVVINPKEERGVNPRITLEFLKVEGKSERLDALMKMLHDEQKAEDEGGQPFRKTLIFVNLKEETRALAVLLSKRKIKSNSICADLSQDQRNEAVKQLAEGNTKILIGTDVCERGLDIQNLQRVINYDMPFDAHKYTHRIGRTGRIAEGLATSFIDTAVKNPGLKDIVDVVKKSGKEDSLREASAMEASESGGFGDDERTEDAGATGSGQNTFEGGGFGGESSAVAATSGNDDEEEENKDIDPINW